MNKLSLAILVSMVLTTACGCATIGKQGTQEGNVADLMKSVVQIHISIALSAVVENPEKPGETLELPLDPIGWTGSGVIYDRSGGVVSPPHSLVLTANHVMEVPEVGYEEDAPFGKIRVDAIMITVVSEEGKTCELSPVTLGVNDHRDVAVGEASCYLGPSAEIADRLPPVGSKVFIAGHPLGFPNIIVTDGWLSGWWGEYLVASAPITGGNSGGPVFFNGKIIGLAVRGSPRYPNLSIIAPLGEIKDRIQGKLAP